MGRGCTNWRARGKDERIAVPAMPMPMAILCCVINFLIPGLGTAIAGTSMCCCCSRNEDMDGSQRCGSCCISFSIGFVQFMLVGFCLIGWVWSCVWGVFFIFMSSEYYHGNTPTDNQVITNRAPGNSVVVTSTVIQHHQPVNVQLAGQQQQSGYQCTQQTAYSQAGMAAPTQPGYSKGGMAAPTQPGYSQSGMAAPTQPGYGPHPPRQPAGGPQPTQPGYGPSVIQTQPPGYYEPPPPYPGSDANPSAPPDSKMY